MSGKSLLAGLLTSLAVAGAALPARAACKLDMLAQVPVTMKGLDPVISAKINGLDANLVLDFGAFFGSISRSRAEHFHLKIGNLPPYLQVRGVNGAADVGLATASQFTLLGRPFPNTQFLLGGPEFGPSVDGVIGRNFLMIADAEIDLANGMVRLFDPKGCGGQPLAYWAGPGAPYSVVELESPRYRTDQILGKAQVNGVSLRVGFDSGASTSVLTLRAAARAGIRRDAPGVVAAGLTGGFGRHSIETWIAPVSDFKIGDEEIKNTRLRIGALELDDVDMLIGADFMLSHHLYVARGQNRLYFTYNGGPVFRLDVDRTLAAPAAPTDAAKGADEPKDAAAYARRAAAFSARREYEQAIADLTRAMALDAKDPQLPYDRAIARLQNRQPLLGMSDLDEALKLKPDFTLALLARGRLKLLAHDAPGALPDFEAALKLDPALRIQVAQIYEGSELFEPAIAHYDRWIADNPKDERLAFALNGRCWARAQINRDLDKALADCDRALKLRPNTASLLDSRGLVHLRLAQYALAIADYDQALKLQPKEAWSLYGRGVAELRTGKTTEGQADLKASAELAPLLAERAKRIGVTAEPGKDVK